MKSRNRVWIVEMLNSSYQVSKWEPTVGCRLTRAACVEARREWKKNNPSDHFRVCEY